MEEYTNVQQTSVQPKQKTSPKDFFLYLASAITMYWSAGSVLALLFGIIDAVYKDNLYSYGFYSGGIRFAMASLFVIFPLFIIISIILRKGIARNAQNAENWVRKWLIYITLFIAGGVVAGDLIAILNSFLGGEITVRFALKVLSLFAMASIIFGYYIYDLKKATMTGTSVRATFAWISGLIILASIIGGFVVAGSPATQRKARLDSNRISDLQSIQWQVINYWNNKGVLPETLDDLEGGISSFDVPEDPDTEDSYEYEVSGDLSFSLCAEFGLDSTDSPDTSRYPIYEYGKLQTAETWEHEAGPHCFERDIDPDLVKDIYPNRIPTGY